MRQILIFLVICLGVAGCIRERFARFSRPAEQFASLASRGDSTAMMRMATGSEPVRRMLAIARADPAVVAAAARGLHASYGSIQGDTAAVEFEPDGPDAARLGFMFLRHGGGWRIFAVQVVHASDVAVHPDSSTTARN